MQKPTDNRLNIGQKRKTRSDRVDFPPIDPDLFVLGDGKNDESTISDTNMAIQVNDKKYVFRSYSAMKDFDNLKEMCEKSSENETDHLSRSASIYEKDSMCEFLVLEEPITRTLVATGNLRVVDPPRGNSIWIEDIRVSAKLKRRGIGTVWMKELCKRAKERGAREILSCTSDTNHAMKVIFGKKGIEMVPVSRFRLPDWTTLGKLPGWSISDERKPQNILKALRIEKLINETSRSRTWNAIKTYDELQTVLRSSIYDGKIGHVPAMMNLITSSDDVLDSIEKGLVRKLEKTDNMDSPAIFALVKDRSIVRLKSQYVCSIVSYNKDDFDAAVWEACQPRYVPLLGGIPSFMCMFEQPHPAESFETGSLQDSLPVQTDKDFIYFRWEAKSNKQT